MKAKHVNEDVEIIILPDATGKSFSTAERRSIQKVIKDNLLKTSKEPYHRVQVEVRHRTDGSPESLMATMLRAYTYTADIVKVNIDPDYTVTSIEPSPKEEEE
jgi:uncharacterized FlgJ-related protein